MPTNFLVRWVNQVGIIISTIAGNDGCNIFYKNEKLLVFFFPNMILIFHHIFDIFRLLFIPPNHFIFMIIVKDQQDFPSIKENEKFSKSLRLGKNLSWKI